MSKLNITERLSIKLDSLDNSIGDDGLAKSLSKGIEKIKINKSNIQLIILM